MKKALFIILFLSASIACACPELTGAYDCKRFIKGYDFDYSINENDVWTFQLNGFNYLADNVSRPLKREGVTGTYKSTCISSERYIFSQEFITNATGSTQAEYSEFYTKNGNTNTLYVEQVFTFGGEDGFVLRINDICKKD